MHKNLMHIHNQPVLQWLLEGNHFTPIRFRFAVVSLIKISTTRNPVELLGPCFKTGQIVVSRVREIAKHATQCGYVTARYRQWNWRKDTLSDCTSLNKMCDKIFVQCISADCVCVCTNASNMWSNLCKAISLSLSLPLELVCLCM